MNLKNYSKVEKPWGSFIEFTLNEPTTVKLIMVDAGKRLSYQSHNHRSEFWRCIKGPIKVILDDKEIILAEGDEVFVPQQAKHRMCGLDTDGCILEISFGQFDENDIVRYEDDFGRVDAKT